MWSVSKHRYRPPARSESTWPVEGQGYHTDSLVEDTRGINSCFVQEVDTTISVNAPPKKIQNQLRMKYRGKPEYEAIPSVE